MPRPIVISVLANANQANQELTGVARTAQKVGNGFRKAAPVAGVALAAIAVGAKKAVDAASDLAENVAKTGEVFGPQAKEIEAFAARAEQALGQSKTAALDAASTFGLIGQKAGLGGRETAEFSKQFTTLASDLASFNNTSPEEAVLAIGAAMRGESEPIRKYGVLLDDATLRNRALKLGLIDSVKSALTPQQKALAASQEILAQTGKAQGDFARTSDGAANKARILAAQSENLKAKLGAQLLPVYERLQGILSRTLTFLGQHQSTTMKVGVAVAALAGFVLAVNAAMSVAAAVTATYRGALIAWGVVSKATTVLQYAQGAAWLAWRLIVVGTTAALNIARVAILAVNAAMRANPIGVVITALALLGAGLAVAWSKSQTFRAIVTGAWNRVKAVAQAVGSFIGANWKRVGAIVLAATGPIGVAAVGIIRNWSRIRSAASSLLSSVKSAFNSVVSFVRGIPGKIRGAFSGAGSLLSNTGRQIIQGLIGGIKAMAGRAIDAAKGAVKGAIDGAKNLLGIKSPSRVFRNIGVQTMQGLALGIRAQASTVRASARAVAADLADTPMTLGTVGVDTAGSIARSSSGTPTTVINVTVEVPVTADKRTVGRDIADALRAYVQAGGRVVTS